MLKVFQSSLLKKFSRIDHSFFGAPKEIPYNSLNSDLSFEKAKDLYITDYHQHICSYFNISFDHFIHLKQIHSDKVIIVDEFLINHQIMEADALITSQPGFVLSIQTADCVPILLYDFKNHVCGAVHSGWKGTLENIVCKTIKIMLEQGACLENMSASIGPCIHQNSFEVGAHFKSLFSKKDPAWSLFFKAGKDLDHVWFDLPGLVKAQLQNAGVQYIDDLGIDTYSDQENFSSYRRTCHENKVDPRRQISAIRLNQQSSIVLKK